MAAATEPKTNWADDAAAEDGPSNEPQIQSTTDANGVTTTVEYRTNEDGKRVKVTRKVKKTTVKTVVNHEVAERKANWVKFGLEKGKKTGPDASTTTVGENIRIKLSIGGAAKEVEPEQDEKEIMRQKLASRKITCRLCQGDHYTTRCPYKDTLGGLNEETEETGEAIPLPGTAAAAAPGAGKYVPPSMRGNRGPGESMYGRREDMPTLRVTNLSEDTVEDDLYELFQRFGRIHRIFVGRDQETQLCKGFAFVSFMDRKEAESAMGRIHGLPYDHQILSCTWSVPRENRDK